MQTGTVGRGTTTSPTWPSAFLDTPCFRRISESYNGSRRGDEMSNSWRQEDESWDAYCCYFIVELIRWKLYVEDLGSYNLI